MNCAFCRAPDPKWFFYTTEKTGRKRWPACNYCKLLIEEGASVQLIGYMVDVFLFVHDLKREEVVLPEVIKVAEAHYSEFRERRAGSPERIDFPA